MFEDLFEDYKNNIARLISLCEGKTIVFDAHFAHHFRIGGPALFRLADGLHPMLRIIINAEGVVLHVLFLRTDWLG